MAKFAEIEERLLECVNDDRLRASLALIRQAAEDIWAGDAPRIVQDYTDHSIAHSERLAGFVVNLLEANDGRDLSTQEMYLLLAGIYLHDIGMQCDVVKFPEIRNRSEALGARFDIGLTARTASRYSIDEQKAIRKNHHYLTAAWVDYATRTGQTVLGPAAKTIPEDLIDDLMDVCKHHAKLPITDCPLTFTFDPTGRKQLVAALLRFADELDVDGHRVSIETVRTFALDPRNSVYWWLHNRTRIIFSARSVIILTIRLHPDDVKQYGSFVHNAFITEFRSKNRPALSVLAQNGIPVVISADSKIVEHDRAEPFPPEILQALQVMRQKHDPLAGLAEEVRTWLQAIRYEVSDPQLRNDHTMDMVATLDLGTVKQRVLVRCIGGEIMPADVDELDGMLDRKTPQGWLISDKRVSLRARERAAQDDAFQVFNLSEFLQQMVWASYFDALISLVERDRIPDLYVDLGCYKPELDDIGQEIGRDRYAGLDAYIDDWMSERGKMHISILGEFGTGKTWFCRHYAYRQLKCYLQNPASERLPLLITLRAFAKAMTAQQLINDALLEQYRLPFVGGAFEVFQEMNRRGKLLLILDGFDEMARQVDYQTVVDNFWELATLVDERSKVILTSRTEYFRWAKESEKILGGEEFGRRTILLSPPQFEVLHLEPFSDDQIHEIITRRLGSEEGPVVASRILATPNLAEIARKPLLVELLLAAMDEVSADVLENPAQVYLYATNKLLLRNIDTRRTFTTTADKLYFLCELAWEMIKGGELRIHYMDIPERIKAYFGDRIKNQHELDTWDYDLRAQTLLHRDAAGYYEFAHKSLAEYFVAFKFAAELDCLAPVFAQTYCEANGKPCKVPIGPKMVAGLSDTFGRFALSEERMTAVSELLKWMVSNAGRLWALIGETKREVSDEVRYVGGNAATLLNALGAPFEEAQLPYAKLSGANLTNANLSRANLRGAVLHKANFTGVTLSQADLYNADLRSLLIDEIGEIRTLATSPIQPVFVCAGAQGIENRGFVRLCDWKRAVWLPSLSLQSKRVLSVVFSPCGRYLACGTEDGIIATWDMRTKEIIFTRRLDAYVAKLTWAPDRNWLVASKGPTSSASVEIWEIPSGKIIMQYSGHKAGVSASVMLPAWQAVISCDFQGDIILWQVDTGKMIHRKRAAAGKWTRDMTTSSDGNRVVFGTLQGNLAIANLPTFDHLVDLEDSQGNFITVQYSPDGQWVVGCSELGDVKVWKPESGKLLFKLRGNDDATSICFTSDGLYLMMALRTGRVKVWNVSTIPWHEECVLEQRLNCQGTKIGGPLSKGLNELKDGIILREWLVRRGAIYIDQ